ncbi:putative S-adenosyl-L-methionine-dependent methyltransferase [Mycolicibacterium litorale]|uniref:S-adenosyl-L-methionine-dependent methyltransferase n=1 Tax=Mycolicibacterium litorale TaxID=758802 RepID=A0A6S6P3B8_9MYCO|nr:class I SAM-dependent methyltransferase [Mycolicibacterium litorale]BCI51877.1 putative S-adenosyl-L-methionine-dependent methyltransferase [Mycolicibacterium litorale]
MARTEGDTWDLASSVGSTATGVAASRALASKQPNPLIHDPYADPLVKAVGLEECIRRADGELHVEGHPMLDNRRACEQIAVRTRFFDDFFADAAAAGVRQAVILASGLDTRAYRLDWPAGTVVYEIDQPEVIEFKTRTLAGLGASPAAELRTVGIDLREDWPTALRDSGFDPSAATAWIAEGLLIYLPPDAQDRLFDNIIALSAPGSRIATEHMDFGASQDAWLRRVSEWSKHVGSKVDLLDLFYTGDRTPAGTYLAERGWEVTVRTSVEAYAANGFEYPEDLAAVAAGSGYLTATLK